jgi:hypothetical protein
MGITDCAKFEAPSITWARRLAPASTSFKEPEMLQVKNKSSMRSDHLFGIDDIKQCKAYLS